LSRRLARVLPLLAVGMITACGSPSASVSPDASVSPGASEGATPGPVGARSDCVRTDLQDPDGDRIDLTGTWREPSGGPVYYLYQDGDCVWYVGGFAPSDGEQIWGPLGLFTVIFEGRLAPDFTLPGHLAVVRTAGNSNIGPEWRKKTWTLEFEPTAEGYEIVLTAPVVESGTFAATQLVKLSDETIDPP
jgi:hypothetical protein